MFRLVLGEFGATLYNYMLYLKVRIEFYLICITLLILTLNNQLNAHYEI